MKELFKKLMGVSLLLFTHFCMGQNVFYEGVLSTFSGTPDVLRTQNGWSSHYVSGTMGGFNSSDKWQAMGEFTSGTYYGHRVQQSRLGLFSGFNNTQPVIQWERNSPFVSPPSLQFRYGSGNPTPSG